MKKYEYLVRSGLMEWDLNKFGQDGWELITVQRDYITDKHWFYLKKEIIK